MYTLPLPGRLYGAPMVFLFTLATGTGFVALIVSLHVRPGRMEHRAISVEVILAGFRYVWKSRVLLGSISLDLFVVLLGGATALMPIFAHDLLHTGPQGLGALRAAPAVGALAVSIWMTFRPVLQRPGVTMFIGVAVYGAATVVFGLSRSLPLSLATLMLVGASDMISVVIRSSMLQLATPASMRGRVSAVNSLFVGASNELGEFEEWGHGPVVGSDAGSRGGGRGRAGHYRNVERTVSLDPGD